VKDMLYVALLFDMEKGALLSVGKKMSHKEQYPCANQQNIANYSIYFMG
jgi:hypothetical protein